MYSMVLAVHVIFPVIITLIWSASQSVLAVSKSPRGKANCRRTEALILYLINTSNEILISIRHGTTLSTLLGFSQEENDLLALLKGMLKPCVWSEATHDMCQICSHHGKVQVTVAGLFLDDKKKVTCNFAAVIFHWYSTAKFCLYILVVDSRQLYPSSWLVSWQKKGSTISTQSSENTKKHVAACQGFHYHLQLWFTAPHLGIIIYIPSVFWAVRDIDKYSLIEPS